MKLIITGKPSYWASTFHEFLVNNNVYGSYMRHFAEETGLNKEMAEKWWTKTPPTCYIDSIFQWYKYPDRHIWADISTKWRKIVDKHYKPKRLC